RVLVLRPAALVRDDEALEPMELRDLPDAVLFDVRVLVRAFAPIRAFAEPAGHDQSAPARFRGLAVGRDRDHRHELHVLVELALRQARAAVADRVEVFAHALLADVDTVEADLDRAVLREEVRDLVPPRV